MDAPTVTRTRTHTRPARTRARTHAWPACAYACMHTLHAHTHALRAGQHARTACTHGTAFDGTGRDGTAWNARHSTGTANARATMHICTFVCERPFTCSCTCHRTRLYTVTARLSRHTCVHTCPYAWLYSCVYTFQYTGLYECLYNCLCTCLCACLYTGRL